MITKRTTYFKCDFCGTESFAQTEDWNDGYGLGPVRIRLPQGWEGRMEFENFCSKPCEAEYELSKAQKKRDQAVGKKK